MERGKELGSASDDLMLGPDVPSKIVFVLGPLVGALIVVVVAMTAVKIVGLAVAVSAFILWYSWRSGGRTRVEMKPDVLHVVLPIREMTSGWGHVREASTVRGLVVTFRDGTMFKSTLYGPVLGAAFIARHLHLGRQRLATSRLLEAEIQRRATGPRKSGPDTVVYARTWPNGPFLAVTLLFAAVAELAGLLA